MTPRQKCGASFRRMRQGALLTQSQVSKSLKYGSAQFVSNWERGVSFPPDEALPHLAKMFNRPVKHLVAVAYRARAMELRDQFHEVSKRFE